MCNSKSMLPRTEVGAGEGRCWGKAECSMATVSAPRIVRSVQLALSSRMTCARTSERDL